MIKRSFHPPRGPLPADVVPTPPVPPIRRRKVCAYSERCTTCDGWGSNRNPVTRLRQPCGTCHGTGRDPRAIPTDDKEPA